jgi:hypothetical protein
MTVQPPGAPEDTLLHRLLVGTQELQRIPPWALLVLMVVNALVAGFVWGTAGRTNEAIIATLLTLGFSLGMWAALWQLPRLRRSFGPDRPSALALTLVFAALTIITGALNAPLWLLGALLGAVATAALYATWVEPFRLGVTRDTLGNGPAPGLRLLHLSDLHVEYLTARERRLNSLITSLQPDVIVFTGDFISLSYNRDERSIQDVRDVIAGWKAPLGVFAVPGTPTVESLELVARFVRDIPHVTLLVNRWQRVQAQGVTLHLAGMITTHQAEADRAAVMALRQTMPADGVRVLLSHTPEVAPDAEEAGFDLLLCGHTHGGQLRLPVIGPLMTGSRLGRRFVMGRQQSGSLTVYTSRGIGMEGLGAPRARFLCPPEIIEWDVRTTTS